MVAALRAPGDVSKLTLQMEVKMVGLNLVGALLIILGVLYMAMKAIFRGRTSEPHSTPTAGRTLEPRRSGIPMFGLGTNWPGLVLIALGAIIMLFGPTFWST